WASRADGVRFETGGAPSFDAFRKPMHVAIAVADRTLCRVPAQPTTLMTIDDDRSIEVACSLLRKLRCEELVDVAAYRGPADLGDPQRTRNRFVRERQPWCVRGHAFRTLRYVRHVDQEWILARDQVGQ